MGNMDDDTLMRLKKKDYVGENKQQYSEMKRSRFIISPDNFWNMIRNLIVQFIAIFYIFVAPAIIVSNDIIPEHYKNFLLIFDVVLMMDRVQDLFLGFYNDGFEEKRLFKVIIANVDYKFFLELVVSFGPLVINMFM